MISCCGWQSEAKNITYQCACRFVFLLALLVVFDPSFVVGAIFPERRQGRTLFFSGVNL